MYKTDFREPRWRHSSRLTKEQIGVSRRERLFETATDRDEAEGDAPETQRDGPRIIGDVGESGTRLEECTLDCETRYPVKMASAGVQVILATKIEG